MELTIAPVTLRDDEVHIKRPGLEMYYSMKERDSAWIPREVLGETLIMEQIPKQPHPNIIHYHGCRVRRGRITAIILEPLDWTLSAYIDEPGFAWLDKARSLTAMESAVEYLHSLGLAHNDINPDNIMIKDGMPVLIDFGEVGSRVDIAKAYERKRRNCSSWHWNTDAGRVPGLWKIREIQVASLPCPFSLTRM